MMPISAYSRIRQAAIEGVVEAARFWASFDGSAHESGYSMEDSCEMLAEAVALLDRVEGRPAAAEEQTNE
jgi:hypothetical protein